MIFDDDEDGVERKTMLPAVDSLKDGTVDRWLEEADRTVCACVMNGDGIRIDSLGLWRELVGQSHWGPHARVGTLR